MTTTKLLLLLFAITNAYSQNDISNIIDENQSKYINDSATFITNVSSYNYLGLTFLSPDTNKIYAIEDIEIKPEFPGDKQGLLAFIKQHYTSPIDNGKKVKGTVFASFIIEKDGSITEIGILHDYGFGSGDEAIRVLEKMPKWIAGKNDSRAVRCMYVMPIFCDGD